MFRANRSLRTPRCTQGARIKRQSFNVSVRQRNSQAVLRLCRCVGANGSWRRIRELRRVPGSGVANSTSALCPCHDLINRANWSPLMKIRPPGRVRNWLGIFPDAIHRLIVDSPCLVHREISPISNSVRKSPSTGRRCSISPHPHHSSSQSDHYAGEGTTGKAATPGSPGRGPQHSRAHVFGARLPRG